MLSGRAFQRAQVGVSPAPSYALRYELARGGDNEVKRGWHSGRLIIRKQPDSGGARRW